jgi:hypothetical protein
MQTFTQKILVQNADDLGLVRRKVISSNEVRELQVDFVINSDACIMCINEHIQNQLDLPVVGAIP